MRETDWKIELVFKIGVFSPEKALKVINLSDRRWKSDSWSRNSFWVKFGGGLVNKEILVDQVQEHQTWHSEDGYKAVLSRQDPEKWINDDLEPQNESLIRWVELLGLFECKDKVSHVANWNTKEVDQDQGFFPFFTQSNDVSDPQEIKKTPSF